MSERAADGSAPAGSVAPHKERSDRRRVLRTLFAAEIRMLLRDRRMVLISIVLPLLIFPAILFITRWVETSRRESLATTTLPYAVAGSDSARRMVRAAIASPSEDSAQASFVERTPADPAAALAAGTVQVVVRLEATDSGPTFRLAYRGDRERSDEAADRMRDALEQLSEARWRGALRTGGFPVAPERVMPLITENVATPERQGRVLVGTMLTPLLVLLLLSGGAIVAADAIAGEKERGTLETLLTTAARRVDIVNSKLLAVIAVGVVIALINILNLLLYASLGVIRLPEGLSLSIPPGTVLWVLVLMLPIAALTSSVLLLVSGHAKSYKEFQLWFLPVFLVFLLPAAASVLPGVPLRSAIAFIPLAGASVAVKAVLRGTADPLFFTVAFASTAGAAALAIRQTTRALSTERLITASELDRADLEGGPALFPRRVLRLYAVMWAVLFIASLWTGGRLGIRGQVVLNLAGIFLLGSLLMIRRYRLDPRRALSLRPVRPVVWLAVLIGAPAAYITGTGLARLTAVFLPVPQKMIEAFGQYLLPPDIPLWQILLFLAVLPGICEEIAFRGVLLHGLRQRLRPAALVIAVGIIFGLFHVDLFRLIPTAYLGILLAAVVVLTGSIFPAMLWHMLNNAVALVPAYFGMDVPAPDAWLYAVAAVGLALAFGILWRAGGNSGYRQTPTPSASS